MPGAEVKPTGHEAWPLAKKALASRDEMVMKYLENTSKNNLTTII